MRLSKERKEEIGKYLSGQLGNAVDRELFAEVNALELERNQALDALTVTQEEWLLRVKSLECKNYALNQDQADLADLRWFRDQINSQVLPGMTDTQDAAKNFYGGILTENLKLKIENYHLSNNLGLAMKTLEGIAIFADYGSSAYEELGMLPPQNQMATNALNMLPNSGAKKP